MNLIVLNGGQQAMCALLACRDVQLFPVECLIVLVVVINFQHMSNLKSDTDGYEGDEDDNVLIKVLRSSRVPLKSLLLPCFRKL